MSKEQDFIPKELIAFAFIEEEYSKTGDITRGLMPLFTPILANKPNAIFDPKWFASAVEEAYDIPMSVLVAEGMVARLTDIGLLYQDSTNANIYKISPNQKTNANLIITEFEALLNDYIKFSSKVLENINFEISKEKIENALLKRFTNQKFLSILDRPEKNFYTGKTIKLKKVELDEDEVIDQEQILDVITANYALHVFETNKDNYNLLTKIASGALIAEVVLTLQTPSPDEKLSNVTLLLDGPILLDFLDLSTVELKSFSQDLFDLINKLNIKKAVLNHTIEEMKGTIHGPLEMAQRNQLPFGPLGDRIRNDTNHAAYARAVYDGLEDILKKLDIEIIEYENYAQDEYLSYCPNDIEEGLRNNLGRAHESLERRIKDAQAISTVLRMRGNKALHPQSITDTNYLLVTRNDAVANRSRSYLMYKKLIDDRDFPPSLTDRQLAGLLWFSAGGSLATISSKKLIANCSYVMHPRTDIVSKMRQCLSNINEEKAEIFTLLMRDGRAQRCLVQSTFGFTSIITTDNAEQLLDEIKKATAAEVMQKASEDIDKINLQNEEKIQQIISQNTEEKISKESEIFNLNLEQQQLNEKLEESEKAHSKEINDLKSDFTIFRNNYENEIHENVIRAKSLADTQYKRTKILFILIYIFIILVITFNLNLSLQTKIIINVVLTVFSFWIIPETIFKPIGSYIWNKSFHNLIKSMNISNKISNYRIDSKNMTVNKTES
jgi:hypothetical protein